MPTEFGSFNFVGTLAAVINGLGIVRWLNNFVEYLRKKDSMTVEHYWVFTLAALFQFLLHILLWWSLWSVRTGGALNFLSYLYMLVGPILLFVGSAFLVPDVGGDRLNLRQHYYSARPVYASSLLLVWAWATLASLVFRGYLADTAPMFALFFAIAFIQRTVSKPSIHNVVAVLNWLVLIVFVLGFALELGGLP